jgi:hypothetical protein
MTIIRGLWLLFFVVLTLLPLHVTASTSSSIAEPSEVARLPVMQWLGEIAPLSLSSTPALEEMVDRTLRLVENGPLEEKGNADDVFVAASGILAAQECIRRGKRILFYQGKLVVLLEALDRWFSDPGFLLRLEDEILNDPTDAWIQRLISSWGQFPSAVYVDFVAHRDQILSVVPVHPTTLRASAMVAFRRADWPTAQRYLSSYLTREPEDPMANLMWVGVHFVEDVQEGEKQGEALVVRDSRLASQVDEMKSRQRLWKELDPLRKAGVSSDESLASLQSVLKNLHEHDRGDSQVEALWMDLLRVHGEDMALFSMAARWLVTSRLDSLWLFVQQDKRWETLPKTEQKILRWLYLDDGSLARVPQEICEGVRFANGEAKEICDVLFWWHLESDASLVEKIKNKASRMGWTPLVWKGGVARLRAAGLEEEALVFAREGLKKFVGKDRIAMGFLFVSQTLSLAAKTGQSSFLAWARDELNYLASIQKEGDVCAKGDCFVVEMQRLQLELTLLAHLFGEKETSLAVYIQAIDTLLANKNSEGVAQPFDRLGLHLLGVYAAWSLQSAEMFDLRVERLTAVFPGTLGTGYLQGVLALTEGNLALSIAHMERAIEGLVEKKPQAASSGYQYWGEQRLYLNGLKLLARAASMSGDEARLKESMQEIEARWEDAYPAGSSEVIEPLIWRSNPGFSLRKNTDGAWLFSPLPREVLMPLPGDPALRREVVQDMLRRLDPREGKSMDSTHPPPSSDVP